MTLRYINLQLDSPFTIYSLRVLTKIDASMNI